MNGNRIQQIISKYDTSLAGIEDATLERVNAALESSYKRLEKDLLQSYQKHSGNLSLLPGQRKLLILDEIKDLLSLVNTKQAEQIQADFENLLRASDEQGRSLATELAGAIANEKLQSFASVPLEAVRFQAEDGLRRLSRHTQDFASKAGAIVEQGLIQGWGGRKTASLMRAELGITKGKAEMLTRTESIASLNSAALSNYKRNDITQWQRIGTADARICGYCLSRHGNAYETEKTANVLLHPRDRCYALPFKPEWAELGLIDQEWWDKSKREMESRADVDPNDGLAPFEKAAGLDKAPEPVWTLDGGSDRP